MQKHYKIIFILGADIRKDDNGNLAMAENDKGGPMLSDWKLKAVKKLYNNKAADRFVIVSYIQPELNVWRCDVMKKILVDNYHVPESIIEVIKQKEKGTMGNVLGIKQYIIENLIETKDCAFLTNFYHIPRATNFLQKINLLLHPIAAESFFIDNDFNTIIKDYKNIDERLINELRGMRDDEFDNYR